MGCWVRAVLFSVSKILLSLCFFFNNSWHGATLVRFLTHISLYRFFPFVLVVSAATLQTQQYSHQSAENQISSVVRSKAHVINTHNTHQHIALIFCKTLVWSIELINTGSVANELQNILISFLPLHFSYIYHKMQIITSCTTKTIINILLIELSLLSKM